MQRELADARIRDPELRRAYTICRHLNSQHGKTYYLATLLLPAGKRPFVHALYGLARYADEIVDSPGYQTPAQRAAALEHLRIRFHEALATGRSPEPVVAAAVDTALRWNIERETFDAFFHSMAMDLHTTSYETFADLREYVHGSAAVIGIQMLPILEPSDPVACRVGAEQLGVAFQLANFIRDVAEDLDRGRIYLPLEELREHGVTPETLRRRVVDDDLRSALSEQVDRVLLLSAEAAPTVQQLHPAVRDTIEAARVLYCGIAEEVRAIDFEVFQQRARVPLRRRLAIAAQHWPAAIAARRRYGAGTIPPAR